MAAGWPRLHLHQHGGGVSNIWLQPVDGEEPRQLTDYKTDFIFSFDWSRDGKQLALSRGTEDRDVILIIISGKHMALIAGTKLGV